MTRALDLCDILPQAHNPRLDMRKTSKKPILRDNLQNT